MKLALKHLENLVRYYSFSSIFFMYRHRPRTIILYLCIKVSYFKEATMGIIIKAGCTYKVFLNNTTSLVCDLTVNKYLLLRRFKRLLANSKEKAV